MLKGRLRVPNFPNIDESKYPLPHITPELLDIFRSLVFLEDDAATVFYGGRLDLGNKSKGEHWLMPVITHHGETSVGLQVVLSNIDLDDLLNGLDPRAVDFRVSLATETEMKLLAMKAEEKELFDQLEHGFDGQRIVVRPVMMGNLAFPFIQHPDKMPVYAAVRGGIMKFAGLLGLGDLARVNMPTSFKPLYDEIRGIEQEFDNFTILKPIKIPFKGKPNDQLFVYNVIANGDVWRTYQIITWKPINELVKTDNPLIRFDSACDTGMLFRDRGCDCHSQLLSTIEQCRNDDGFVIHVPGHEGRGYGMVTKLETELLKQGLGSARFPTNNIKRDTIMAAKMLFGGQQFDIRTFFAPGLLLKELGFSRVRVATDNRQKIKELKAGSGGDVEIERIPTSRICSVNFSNGEIHLASKHNNRRYFGD